MKVKELKEYLSRWPENEHIHFLAVKPKDRIIWPSDHIRVITVDSEVPVIGVELCEAKPMDAEMIRAAEADEAAAGWIPVAERMPEPGKIVMVKQTYGSEEYGPITIGRRKPVGTDCSEPYWEFLQYRKDFRDTRIADSGVICPGNKFVIAWMPMPEPYREV